MGRFEVRWDENAEASREKALVCLVESWGTSDITGGNRQRRREDGQGLFLGVTLQQHTTHWMHCSPKLHRDGQASARERPGNTHESHTRCEMRSFFWEIDTRYLTFLSKIGISSKQMKDNTKKAQRTTIDSNQQARGDVFTFAKFPKESQVQHDENAKNIMRAKTRADALVYMLSHEICSKTNALRQACPTHQPRRAATSMRFPTRSRGKQKARKNHGLGSLPFSAARTFSWLTTLLLLRSATGSSAWS